MANQSGAGIALERRGSGDPLLLVHGTGGSRLHWAPITELLEPHHDLLLVDLPGHGASEPPPDGIPHNPIGYAQLLVRMLDELGLNAAHAVGNSVGGWTALELAKLGRARSVDRARPGRIVAKARPVAMFVPALEPIQARTTIRAAGTADDAQRAWAHAPDGRDGGKAKADPPRGGYRDGKHLCAHPHVQSASQADAPRTISRRAGHHGAGDGRLGRQGTANPNQGAPALRAASTHPLRHAARLRPQPDVGRPRTRSSDNARGNMLAPAAQIEPPGFGQAETPAAQPPSS